MDSDVESINTDSENDVNEIEAMLYSQLHHSARWSSHEDEITDIHAVKHNNASVETAFISAPKDKPSLVPSAQSSAILSNGTIQIPLVNKENVQRAANDDIIILSSDDECEILDYCGVSKYNYNGVKENSTNMNKGLDTKITKNESCTATKTTSTVANLYIHIDDDEGETDTEKIAVDSKGDIMIVSSSVNKAKRNSKRKSDDSLSSVNKRQATASGSSRHLMDDEDCIVEIPVPVRNGDDWFICAGDRLQKAPNRRKDFHDRKLNIICHNCNQRGHISKTCSASMKKIHCYICGDTGHHGDRCFRAMCSVCRETGHSTSSCPQRKRIPYKKCNLCHYPGHLEEHCPDLWRRYHLTIGPGKLVTETSKLKPRDSLFCCNCGRKGHFVHECSKKRMDVFVLPNRPDVVDYNALLPTPSCSQTQTADSSNASKNKTFGKFQHWKRNFKQESRHIVSSVKQKFGRHLRFGDKSPSKFGRKKHSFMGNPFNNEERIQNAQQTDDCPTNARERRKMYWKKLNRSNSKWLVQKNN